MDNALSHGMADVQRYIHGAGEIDLQPQHVTPTTRVDPETTRVVTRGGVQVVETAGQEKGRASELNPHHGSDSVLATAQHPKGLPVYRIEDETLITVNGVQASAAFWAKEGVLTKNPEGDYVEATEAPQAEPEAFDGEVDPIPEQYMAAVNAALEPLPQDALDGFAAVAVGAAVGRIDQAAMVTKFAQASGVDLADAEARIGAVAQVYRVQTLKALAKQGIGEQDAEAFFDYCRKHKPEAMQEAIGRQLHAHDVSRWAPLARQWLAEVAPSVETLKAAGLQTRKSSHGAKGHEVFIPGAGKGWMSLSAAARSGLI